MEKNQNSQQIKDNQVSNSFVPNKKLDNYKLIIVLGKGSYGKVVLVKNIIDKQIYAMKILKKKEIEQNKQRDNVLEERNALVKVKHPFIIGLRETFQTNDKLYFVMEYAPGGELYNLLSKRKRFTEDQTRFYAAQILLAVEALHLNNIIYRDLKPENVLIDIEGYLRIADFGLSKGDINGERSAKSICGTPEYLAPEIIKREGHGKPVDWWTLGCIIFEMIVGLPPFRSEHRDQLFQLILYQELEFPKFITPQCRDLMKKLLIKNPKERLGSKEGAQEIKSHPWFRHIDWQHVYDQAYAPPFTPIIRSELDVRNFDREFTEININSVNSKSQQSQLNGKYIQGFTYMATLQSKQSNIEECEDDDQLENQEENEDNQQQEDDEDEEQEGEEEEEEEEEEYEDEKVEQVDQLSKGNPEKLRSKNNSRKTQINVNEQMENDDQFDCGSLEDDLNQIQKSEHEKRSLQQKLDEYDDDEYEEDLETTDNPQSNKTVDKMQQQQNENNKSQKNQTQSLNQQGIRSKDNSNHYINSNSIPQNLI